MPRERRKNCVASQSPIILPHSGHVRGRRFALAVFLIITMAVVPALATTGSVERLPLAGLDARAGEARSSSSHPSARKPEAVPKAPAPRELHSTGKLAPVPPEAETSADSRGLGFAVEVERGVPVEPSGFGREVERTLLDERGWTAAGTHYIARTCALRPSGSRWRTPKPPTSSALRSRRRGPGPAIKDRRVVLNAARWLRGSPVHRRELRSYRQYMVNHEVGHALGEDHLGCSGPGRPAPVMMQQSKGLEAVQGPRVV